MSANHLFQLVLLAAIWGASFMFMVVAVPEFGAFALIELRVFLAAMVLLPFWWLREGKSQAPLVRQNIVTIVWVGLLNSAAPFVLFAYSVLYISGGIAAVLNSTAPIWGALVAWLWLKERLSLAGNLGLVIGVLGVITLVSGELFVDQGMVPPFVKATGLLAAALAPVLYGIAANLTSAKLKNISPLSTTTFSLVAASIVLLPFALFNLPQQMPSQAAWLCAIVLAIACTSLASLMFFRLISEIGSTKAITVAFMIPLFGTLWGVSFIGESVSITMLIGMAIILAGTALVVGLWRPKIFSKP